MGKGGENVKMGGRGGGRGVGEQFKCLDAGEKFESLWEQGLKMVNDCGLYVVCIPNMVCFMLPPELQVGVFSVPELFTRTAAIYIIDPIFSCHSV